MEQFEHYGYLGIFGALLAAGFGLPLPEELPVLTAGVLCGHDESTMKWYIMLPVCIAGVVIGDGVLYGAGRFFGSRILENGWVQRKLITPDKRAEIEKNFHDRGIAVLLGARLLPGIRSPMFIMAGVLRVPLTRFMLADGLYAIPGVNLLFWTAYFLTDQVLVVYSKLHDKFEHYKPLLFVGLLSGVAGVLVYKYLLSRRVSTGEPVHVPPVIAKPAGAVAHMVEHAVDRVTHRHPSEPPVSDAGVVPATPAAATPPVAAAPPEPTPTTGGTPAPG